MFCHRSFSKLWLDMENSGSMVLKVGLKPKAHGLPATSSSSHIPVQLVTATFLHLFTYGKECPWLLAARE